MKVSSLLLFVCALCFSSTSYSVENNSFVKYQQFALLSNVAYETEDQVRQVVEKNGWVVTHSHTLPNSKVRYFVATHKLKKSHIVVVRGTANVENVVVDAAHKLVPNGFLNIKLHEGFSGVAEKIYPGLKTNLNRHYRVSTTGHSLGGGVAVILAMYLQKGQYEVGETVTFGQPKITNLAGALKYKQLPLKRIVTPKDLVPLVPPFDIADIKNLDVYWHLGTEVILYPGQKYSEISGLDSMLRAANILTDTIDQRNLDHHQMSRYLDLIKQKTNQPVKVTYERRVNLLDMFSAW